MFFFFGGGGGGGVWGEDEIVKSIIIYVAM